MDLILALDLLNGLNPVPLGLAISESSISSFFSEFGYLAPFTILVLCGFGLPVPEEITMLGSGFLLSQGRVEALPIVAVCWAGTLTGDSIPFWLGRLWGRRALQIRSVRRALNPARIRALERRFEQSGERAILACRFIPGLRLPAWFTAGTLGMPYIRFLALDALGAAIMTPVFIYIGLISGEKITELESTVEDLTQILGFAAVALAAVVVITFFSRRLPTDDRRASRASDGADFPSGFPSGSSSGPSAGPSAGLSIGPGATAGEGPAGGSSQPETGLDDHEVLDGDRP